MRGDPRPVLRLNQGHRLRVAKWPREASGGALPNAVVGTFDSIDTPLGRITKAAFRPRGEDERELTFPELFRELYHPQTSVPANAVRSELHKRLVVVATTLILPMLALPFALGRRRGHRAYRFAIALTILVAFHEIIEQGALAARMNGVSPWLAIWAPFALLFAFSSWRYYNTCFRLTPSRLDPFIERASEAVRGLKGRFGGYFGWSEA